MLRLTPDDKEKLNEFTGVMLIACGIILLWAGVTLGMFLFFVGTR